MSSAQRARVHGVLGMHRSGTSWLAGSLQERGLPFGEVNESATYNAKGTRENDALQAIHVGVLRDSKGTWRDPPRRVVWSDERRAQLRAFIDEMNAQYEQWGFKDPRTLLFLDEWLRQVPQLELVGIYRHPEAVARSLAKRDFSPVDRRPSLRLWRTYNARLVEAHRREPFPILRFDVPEPDLFGGLDAVAERWDLPGVDGSGSFFEEELVHEGATSGGAVPISCRRIWKYLVEHTLGSP
jgi:hypothetical protein